MKVVIFCKNTGSSFVSGLSRDAVRGAEIRNLPSYMCVVNYALNRMKMLVGSTAVWGGRLDPKRSDLLFR